MAGGGFMAATLTLGALAEHLGATLEGDPAAVVTGVADLQSARAGQVSFAGNPKYMSAVATSGATAVIVPQLSLIHILASRYFPALEALSAYR